MVAVGVAYWARKSDLESIINSENEMMEAQMLSADQYLLVSRMTQSAAETPVRPERIKIEARIASHRKWRRRRALRSRLKNRYRPYPWCATDRPARRRVRGTV